MIDYELGLLYACTGETKESKSHFDLVLSGKPLVHKTEKGKYSMEVRSLVLLFCFINTG